MKKTVQRDYSADMVDYGSLINYLTTNGSNRKLVPLDGGIKQYSFDYNGSRVVIRNTSRGRINLRVSSDNGCGEIVKDLEGVLLKRSSRSLET